MTDTYSLQQTQEEFYFGLPLGTVDLLLYALNNGIAPDDAAAAVALEPAQVARVFRDLAAKRRVAARALADAALVDPVGLGDGTG
jgi:NAD+ synthase